MTAINSNIKYAVLTGDLINSTKLSPSEHGIANQRVKTSWMDARERFGEDVLVETGAFFRGDSWQIVIANPAIAFPVAIFIRAALRCGVEDSSRPRKTISFDSRVAVGVGSIDTLNPGESTGLGEAYTRSGRRLDRLSKQKVALGAALSDVDSNGSEESPEIETLLTLMDFIVSAWTPRQAQAIQVSIRFPKRTQSELGGMLLPRAKQAAFTQLLARSGWRAVEKGLKLLPVFGLTQ